MTTTINHHLDDATLMSFSSGTLGEALGAVAAVHLAKCGRCRRELSLMQEIGGALMGELDGGTLRPTSNIPPVALPQAAEGRRTGDQASGVADIIQRIINNELDDIRWRPIAPGVRHHRIALSPGAPGDLRLLRIEPGRAMPDHGHGGSELTVVLRGSYNDCFGKFAAGDVADLDSDAEHQPVVGGDEACICLIASDQRARFKGLISRLMQPFVGI